MIKIAADYFDKFTNSLIDLRVATLLSSNKSEPHSLYEAHYTLKHKMFFLSLTLTVAYLLIRNPSDLTPHFQEQVRILQNMLLYFKQTLSPKNYISIQFNCILSCVLKEAYFLTEA